MSAIKVDIDINGRIRSVAVELVDSAAKLFRVSWDDVTRTVDFRQLAADTCSVIVVEGGAGSHYVRCVDTDRQGGLDLHVNGAVVHARVNRGLTRLTRRADHVASTSGGQYVTAPMPGKVVRLLVQPGDEVEERQGVVVVEAMKMENELRALRAGKVVEVLIDEGDSVETGKVLVVIE